MRFKKDLILVAQRCLLHIKSMGLLFYMPILVSALASPLFIWFSYRANGNSSTFLLDTIQITQLLFPFFSAFVVAKGVRGREGTGAALCKLLPGPLCRSFGVLADIRMYPDDCVWSSCFDQPSFLDGILKNDVYLYFFCRSGLLSGLFIFIATCCGHDPFALYVFQHCFLSRQAGFPPILFA